MEPIINLNEKILTNYQRLYPNLKDFSYDATNDALIYEGNAINLNGDGLSRIDPVFFQMLPEDIFAYIKCGFYVNANENQGIEALFNQLVITEEEVISLESFAQRFNIKCQIYSRNKQLLDELAMKNDSVASFTKSLIESNNLINQARLLSDNPAIGMSAASILYHAYENDIQKINSASLANENNNESTQEKGMSLTRTKAGFSGFDEERYIEEKSRLGIAGFSSIILLIAATITAGIYLAITVLK